MKHLLEVKDIHTCFMMEGKKVRAVDGVSFHLDRGKIVGV